MPLLRQNAKHNRAPVYPLTSIQLTTLSHSTVTLLICFGLPIPGKIWARFVLNAALFRHTSLLSSSKVSFAKYLSPCLYSGDGQQPVQWRSSLLLLSCCHGPRMRCYWVLGVYKVLYSGSRLLCWGDSKTLICRVIYFLPSSIVPKACCASSGDGTHV